MEHNHLSPDQMASDTLITPAGEVIFANVLKPKTVNRGTPKEKLQYGIVLLQADPEVDPDAKAFIGSLHRAFMEKFGGNAKYGANGKPWKRETRIDENGVEIATGLTRISFSRDTATRSGMELPAPLVTDAKGNPWPTNVAIGNGSICRIAYSHYLWDNIDGGKGISLNLIGVRVLAHVPYNVGTVSPDVFGAPEAGVDASTLQADEPKPFGLFGDAASSEEIPF
jgi:hypothetical protein